MRVKKFVISNIILSIILIVILYILSWIYINYVNYKTVKFMEYNKLPDNSINIVTLGSSHGMYGLKLIKNNQMNLGLEKQGFYYGLKLLKKYEKKIKENSIVIIPISIFNFYEKNDFLEDETYKNYINLLEKKEIRKNLKNSEYYLSRNFSIIYPPSRFIKMLKFLRKEKKEKVYISYDRDLSKEELTEAARETSKQHTENLKEEYKKNGIRFLNNILNYCEKRKYKIVFIVTPYWHEYVEELEKIENNIFENKIYKNLKEIEEERKKYYIFLDYSKDERFENNAEYFMDDDHLNEKGAEYFTEILLEDIEKEIENERKI